MKDTLELVTRALAWTRRPDQELMNAIVADLPKAIKFAEFSAVHVSSSVMLADTNLLRFYRVSCELYLALAMNAESESRAEAQAHVAKAGIEFRNVKMAVTKAREIGLDDPRVAKVQEEYDRIAEQLKGPRELKPNVNEQAPKAKLWAPKGTAKGQKRVGGDCDEDDEEVAPQPKKRAMKPKHATVSDCQDDDEEIEMPVPKKTGRK
jgi:hypothetical protein